MGESYGTVEVWSRQALARHVRERAVEAGFPALSRAAKATVHEAAFLDDAFDVTENAERDFRRP